MAIEGAISGNMFAHDFLNQPEVLDDLPGWRDLNDEGLSNVEDRLRGIFNDFGGPHHPIEAETDARLIQPTMQCLGWAATLPQQNLSQNRRMVVPDHLLFADAAARRQAEDIPDQSARYAIGVALMECKRWLERLDRAADAAPTAPSTQMLSYLRKADNRTEGQLRWGILTNGACWRLYYQGCPFGIRRLF